MIPKLFLKEDVKITKFEQHVMILVFRQSKC